MANSKKPAVRSEAGLLRQAVLDCLAQHERNTQNSARIALAYSGGIDSSVLLHVLAGIEGLSLIALHIHHGLSPNADGWLKHCVAQCAQLQVPLVCRQVTLDCSAGASLEAAARTARYAALQELCAEHQATVLLTAHHADDQAETVMLNLLRGTGVAGLAGMAGARTLGDIALARPFLAIDAASLHAHAHQHHLEHIEDESNLDRRFTRNAIRHELMPALRRIAPSATQRLLQTAAHAGEAQALLDEIGRDDLAACAMQAGSLGLTRLRQLSDARASNVLRTWFRSLTLLSPSTAAMAAMLQQIRHSAADAQMRIEHDGHILKTYRERLLLDARDKTDNKAKDSATPQAETEFFWRGEDQLEFPQWQGRLCFVPTSSAGIAASWLGQQPLLLAPRRGGERLKLHPQRPSRSLKNLYQEQAIPVWQRSQLPVLHAGSQLLLAAGLGVDVRLLQDSAAGDDHLIRLAWETLP